MILWPRCGWCGKKWNPPRKRGWLGKLICPTCEEYPRYILHRLIKYDIVKLRKKSKLPTPYSRKRDWGHLGTFDPSRPWMKWTKCKFCTQPMCVNNNAEHKVRIPMYKGYPVCGNCVKIMRIFNKRLVKMKYMRFID